MSNIKFLSCEGRHLGAMVSTEQGEFIFTQSGENSVLITLTRPGANFFHYLRNFQEMMKNFAGNSHTRL